MYSTCKRVVAVNLVHAVAMIVIELWNKACLINFVEKKEAGSSSWGRIAVNESVFPYGLFILQINFEYNVKSFLSPLHQRRPISAQFTHTPHSLPLPTAYTARSLQFVFQYYNGLMKLVSCYFILYTYYILRGVFEI